MKFGFPWMDPDVNRMLASLNVPPLDLDAMAAAQRKNVEAMSAACLVALDCIHESARKQASLLTETVDQVFAAAREVSAGGKMNSAGGNPMDAQRALIERGLANMREIADLIAKSNSEAFEIVSRRAADCLDEMKDLTSDKK
ncbi:MAG: phasin family protein [Alphaproteobacteria bacterium]|nr:phasin family protein [Alphaproteobacteria bacterium]